MVLDFHLKIETSKLTEMSVSVRVLGSEDGTDFEDSLEISAKRHLFVELWALGEASWLSEIFKSKNVGTTLRCTTD